MEDVAMRIAVVIPAYNAAHLIGPTLASVAAQSRAADEVIVVDDGSTDDTAAVAASIGARVISTRNRGLSAARNTGIASAGCDWIALLDADDLWHPDKLARQVHALSLAPDCALVSCDHYQFRGEGEVLTASILDDRRPRYGELGPEALAPGIDRLRDMGTRLIHIGMAFFPSTWLLRRDLAIAIGGFDEDLRRCEDYEFLLRALAHRDLLVVDTPLMGYRIHPDGISRNPEAMSLALVDVGERLASSPERYAPCVAAVFASRMCIALMDSAGFALKRGDLPRARALLARAGAIRRDRRWLAMTLASRLPAGSIAALSAVKRRLGSGS